MRTSAFALLFICIVGSVPVSSDACTAFALIDGDRVLVGKNLDWDAEDGALLTNPRGRAKASLDGEFHWSARYGSVTFNHLGREFPLGGMNEAGLVVEEASYWPSVYPEPGDRPELNEFQWVQYQLDRHATVAEVIEDLESVAVLPIVGGLHYLVTDLAGEAAVIEFLDGEVVVHDAAIPVLANDTYANSLRYLESHAGFGGTREAGPGPESPERFARVATQIREAPATVDEVNRILDDASQQDTVWRLVYDPRNQAVVYRTASAPGQKTLRVTADDFAPEASALGIRLEVEAAPDVRASMELWGIEQQELLARSVFGQLPQLEVSAADVARVEFASPPLAASPATVRFLANAGVSLEVGGVHILIDALFDLNAPPGKPPYRYGHLDREQLDQLERGTDPFTCADVVLVTHGHDDHAAQSSLLRHLEHCPGAELYLPDYAWNGADPGWPEERVHGVSIPRGASSVVRQGDVQIQALGMRHGSSTGREPAHVGWLISGEGLRILHVGDTTPMPDNLRSFDGALDAPLDLAIVPHWFVTHDGGRAWLLETLKPREIAVVHVVQKDPAVMRALDAVRADHPDIVVLTDLFQELKLPVTSRN